MKTNLNYALAMPSFFWFLFFIFAPLFLVFIVSLAIRGSYGEVVWHMSLGNYLDLISSVTVRIFIKTIVFAGATALACSGFGVLAAWAMAAAPRRYREIYLALIVVPFLTNGLIRILGLKSFVAVDGPLDRLLTWIHVAHDPFLFTSNFYLVAVGMVTAYFPFAVLPLYGAFEKFDFTLIEAARDLGAGNLTILWRVVLPVLKRPLMGASFLVFIPCLGEYLIPDLLGGAKTLFLGNLITEKFLKARDWPMGSALAMALIGCLMFAWAGIFLLERGRERGRERGWRRRNATS